MKRFIPLILLLLALLMPARSASATSNAILKVYQGGTDITTNPIALSRFGQNYTVEVSTSDDKAVKELDLDLSVANITWSTITWSYTVSGSPTVSCSSPDATRRVCTVTGGIGGILTLSGVGVPTQTVAFDNLNGRLKRFDNTTNATQIAYSVS